MTDNSYLVVILLTLVIILLSILVYKLQKVQEAQQTKLQQAQTKLQELQTKLQEAQTKLQESQTNLQEAQTKLQKSKTKLQKSKTQLQEAQTELHESQIKLRELKIQLPEAQAKLQESQIKLHELKTQLQEAQTKLQEAEKIKLQEAQQINRLPLSARQLCRHFPFKEIQLATNNFQEEFVIGRGGFGLVYKGIIDSKGRTVAIKRLKLKSKQGNKEFQTEIEMLSQFKHSNLVSLIGYCDDCDEMILVYDYMPRGTLADHLHEKFKKDDSSLRSLSWVQRLKICIGAARGLDYLHTGTSTENRVIHRDVKTTNILLDENLAAKISDFGLSKIGPANQTSTYVSTRVKGTRGYLDPYYLITQRLTRKTDVYAFGVVLFEVLCGRPALDMNRNKEQMSLAGWAQHCFAEGLLDQITDPRLEKNISSDSLNAYANIAIKCLQYQPKHRPTMSEVVVGLECALTLQVKSSVYYLPEIIPTDLSLEELDSSMLEVKNTEHHQGSEFTGIGTVSDSNGSHSKKQKMVSGVISGTTQGFSGKDAVSSSNVLHKKKQKIGFTKRFGGLLSLTARVFRGKKQNQDEVLKSSNLKSFGYNDLKLATRDFHPDSVIGEGGFGCVYKGWVDEKTFAARKWGTGLVIAVKKLQMQGSEGHEEWLAEITCLATLSHPNLVKLMGYCLEDELRFLVYEFMPNGSLDKHLFKKDNGFQLLTWNLRMSIALGAAKGLAYLHSPKINVIHRDFKTSNILIDSKYDVKLSDFGMAKDGPENGFSHVTTRVMGTHGYVAPEYMDTGHVTMKTDVYSFGIVLLEILTGRRVIDKKRPIIERNLISWAKPHLTSDTTISRVMDVSIQGQYTISKALQVSSLVLQCLSYDPKLRPDANQLVTMLEKLQNLDN